MRKAPGSGSLGALGTSPGHVLGTLGHSWETLGHSWDALGRSWGAIGHLLWFPNRSPSIVEPHFGPSWLRFGVPNLSKCAAKLEKNDLKKEFAFGSDLFIVPT